MTGKMFEPMRRPSVGRECGPAMPTLLATQFVLATLLVGAAHAAPVRIFGGTPIVAQDGLVIVVYLGDSNSLFNNRLYLEAPGPLPIQLFESRSSVVGAPLGIGPYTGGTVLQFADRAVFEPDPAGYDFRFFTGTGADNPDRLPHAVFTFDPDDPMAGVTVGFEDLYGGGDLDFNDLQFSLTNVGIQLLAASLGSSTNPLGSTINFAAGNSTSFGSFGESYQNQGTFNNAGNTQAYDVFTNSGTFSNSGDFFADLTSSVSNQFGALLANEAGGTLNFGGGLFNIGSIINEGNATVLQGVLNSGVIQNAATALIRVLGDATVENSGQINNSGTFSSSGSILNAPAGSWDNLFGSLTEISNSGSFNNAGSFNVSGTVSNDGQFVNSGTFNIGSTGSFSGTGSVLQGAGSMIDMVIDGLLGGSSLDIQGGSLGGSGTITAPTIVGPGGEVNPGNSPGTLTIDNTFSLLGGTLNIELGGRNLFDSLLISGAAGFTGGTVNFYFDYAPLAGDSFSWLTAGGGLNGWETLSYNFYNAGSMLQFDTLRVDNSLILTARDRTTTVPEPATSWLLALGLFLLWAARRLPRNFRAARH